MSMPNGSNLLRSLIEDGWKDYESSDQLSERGPQTWAYVAMTEHARLAEASEGEQPGWDDFLAGSVPGERGTRPRTARLVTRFMHHLHNEVWGKKRPERKVIGAALKERQRREVLDYTAEQQRWRRAIVLAAKLVKAGIGPDDFDTDKRFFRVSVSLIVAENETPVGALKRAADKKETVLLDNSPRPWHVLAGPEDAEEIVSIKVNTARLFAVRLPPAAAKGPRRTLVERFLTAAKLKPSIEMLDACLTAAVYISEALTVDILTRIQGMSVTAVSQVT